MTGVGPSAGRINSGPHSLTGGPTSIPGVHFSFPFQSSSNSALLLDSVKKNQNQKQPENQKSIKNSVSTPFRPQRFSHSQSFACGFSTSSFQEQQLDKRTQDLAGTQARAQAKESRIPRRLEGLKVSPLQLCTSGLDATSISKTLPCATVVSLEEPLVSPTFSGGLASRQETPQEEQEQFSFHRKKASAPLGEPFNPSQVCRRHSACSDPSFQDQDAWSPLRPEDLLRLNAGVEGPLRTLFQGWEGVKLEEEAGWVEFHVGREAQGPKVSPPNVCISRVATTVLQNPTLCHICEHRGGPWFFPPGLPGSFRRGSLFNFDSRRGAV